MLQASKMNMYIFTPSMVVNQAQNRLLTTPMMTGLCPSEERFQSRVSSLK